MKTKVLIILSYLSIAMQTSGQNVKDYFLPESGKNKVSFYTPDKQPSGLPSDMGRMIYYINKGNTFIVFSGNTYKGEPMAVFQQTIKFTEKEVLMIQSVSTNQVETNKKQNYTPPQVIFILPQIGQKANWSQIKPSSNEIDKYVSEWTSIEVDGKIQSAIKVTMSWISKGHLKGKIIEYYVKGIGLWKTQTLVKGRPPFNLYVFDKLEFDSEANEFDYDR